MFSILICSHNPDLKIFQHLLSAIEKFETNSIDYEVIIVDNNSEPSLGKRQEMLFFLENKTKTKLITETKPGLTWARVAGIKHSNYEWIILFDDDNEPTSSYLKNAKKLIHEYPHVGCWGPGKLNVIYTEIKKETNFQKKIKWLFQERDYQGTFIDNDDQDGSEYYPFGTGMIVRKNIMDKYLQMVETGKYSMTDRNGKNLSSAGDTQILFTGLKMGYYAGSSYKLELNHLINNEKSTSFYAVRLIYALNSSHIKAYNEVFPEKRIAVDPVKNKDVIKIFIQAIRSYTMHKKKYTLPMLIARKMGELNARLIASHNLKKPLLLTIYEKFI